MSEDDRVYVGRTAINIPAGLRPAMAEEIAERLAKRLQEIEHDYGRVDTQGHALRLAFEYALKIHEIREQQEKENAELAVVLKELNEELERTLGPTPTKPRLTAFQRPTG